MEGLAREFVRRVQDFRKQAELDIADRILVTYDASAKLAEAIEQYRDFIMAETLAVKLEKGKVGKDSTNFSDEFDKETVSIGLIRSPKN